MVCLHCCLFDKYPIEIGKKQVGLIFRIWCMGEKGYRAHYPSAFCRTYCITLGIEFIFQEIVFYIVIFFLQARNKIHPKPNCKHNPNPNPNPNPDLTIIVILYPLFSFLGLKTHRSFISSLG